MSFSVTSVTSVVHLLPALRTRLCSDPSHIQPLPEAVANGARLVQRAGARRRDGEHAPRAPVAGHTRGRDEALLLQAIEGRVDRTDRHFAISAGLDLATHVHAIRVLARVQHREHHLLLEDAERIVGAHCSRRTMAGSVRLARMPGMTAARTPTTSSTAVADPLASGSLAPT